MKNWARTGLVCVALLVSVAPAFADAPIDQYDVFGRDSLTIFDKQTHLEWQRTVKAETMKWVTARDYCSTLVLPNAGGWRLPTYKELLTIVDEHSYIEHDGAARVLAADPFHDAPVPFYWTATPRAVDPRYAWAINFKNGESGVQDKDVTNYVRCVRDF